MVTHRHSPEAVTTATAAALALVSRRALTAHELRNRLARKGFPETEQAAAVMAMQRYGYIDDDALASRIARAAGQQRRGPLWVAQTLRRRGVANGLVEQASRAIDDSEALTAARAALARRYAELNDPKIRARAFRFLCNRGFTIHCARAAIDAGPFETGCS